jgi:sugar (pentulose or hexulose) kinase
MTEPLILTFDIGTQSGRAMLVNSRGDIVYKVQKIYDPPYFSKHAGWAEQKAETYWESICETSLALKEKAGILWNSIIAVTCTTIRDSCVCLDKNNEPLRDVIVWLDDRKAENLPALSHPMEIILKLAGIFEGVKLQRRNSVCNWLIYNEKEIWDKTNKYVFISTWLNYKLCGNLVDSTASVIGHVPFDTKTRSWMAKRDFRRIIFDVSDDKFFELANPGDVIGKITVKTADESGIPAGLPLIATGSDKGCETLGLSCLSEDSAALSFGTTATIQFSTKRYIEPVPHIPAYPSVVPGYFNPEIQIYRGYWLLSWFNREFAAKEVIQAAQMGISAEQLLDERLNDINPGCDGLIMQPYFTPGIDMPFAKGAVIGFSDVHTRIHLYRAIIEGINFSLIHGMRSIEKRGQLEVKKLFVAGGGSKSNAVCKITASMFGLPVYRIQTYEAAGIGSSIAAFVSQGIFSSWEEGIAAMSHIKDEFLPNKEHHAIYQGLYEKIFKKIFSKLAPLYQEISEIIKE